MRKTLEIFYHEWTLNILILWNHWIVHVSVLRKEQRAIHMLVHDITKGYSSIISGIYAPAQQRDKELF